MLGSTLSKSAVTMRPIPERASMAAMLEPSPPRPAMPAVAPESASVMPGGFLANISPSGPFLSSGRIILRPRS
nr:hypothetical protein [Candidatus Methanomethylophilus sp. 1R26]